MPSTEKKKAQDRARMQRNRESQKNRIKELERANMIMDAALTVIMSTESTFAPGIARDALNQAGNTRISA